MKNEPLIINSTSAIQFSFPMVLTVLNTGFAFLGIAVLTYVIRQLFSLLVNNMKKIWITFEFLIK